MNKIRNPILSGFHPDPSIVRVGDNYYIATSTFEWFPGVQIHHSRDLRNWKLITHPLDRVAQLDLKGDPASGGVWAPCLTYSDGLFYLVYTDMKHKSGPWKDAHNYLVTAADIRGPWSEPIYLNSSGFDPSLFHDDDGRKWLLNMLWDHRKKKGRFAGIVLQEYCPDKQKLVGTAENIFKGTELGTVEGPHLYKRNGYYYLLTAEGGTGYGHAVTMARATSLFGPYEVDSHNPVLTSRDDPELELQKAGHGDIVQTQTGHWYMVHLCARPLTQRGRCILGRETAIQKVYWNNEGWLRLENGKAIPDVSVDAPDLPEYKFEKAPARDEFNREELSVHFQTLRVPLMDTKITLTERQGYLRIKGGESLGSKHVQALVARRQQAFSYTAETCIEFEPETFQQMAGLIAYYDCATYYYLHISHDEELGKSLSILTCDNGSTDYPLKEDVPIEGWERCHLKAQVDKEDLRFFYSKDGETWSAIGDVFDASKLSDDYPSEGSCTGAFIGLCCQDLSGKDRPADFDFFEYVETE